MHFCFRFFVYVWPISLTNNAFKDKITIYFDIFKIALTGGQNGIYKIFNKK